MHIHGNQANLNTINPYSAAAEKATAAQRAADTRKKLLKSASGIEGSASPEEALMVGKWIGATNSQTQVDVEYHTASAGRDSDFG
jgi:hypothetical protein